MKNQIANLSWINRLSVGLLVGLSKRQVYLHMPTHTNLSKKYFILTQSSNYYSKSWIESQNNKLVKDKIEEHDKNKCILNDLTKLKFVPVCCSNKISCDDKFNVILEKLEKIIQDKENSSELNKLNK